MHFSNKEILIYLFSGISSRTIIEKRVWELVPLSSLFAPKHKTSFLASPSALILLIITSILDIKWRVNNSAIQVTFRVPRLFEGCQTSVFHLERKREKRKKEPCRHLVREKKEEEQDNMREKSSIQGSGNGKKKRLWGSLCDRLSSRRPPARGK